MLIRWLIAAHLLVKRCSQGRQRAGEARDFIPFLLNRFKVLGRVFGLLLRVCGSDVGVHGPLDINRVRFLALDCQQS